MGIFLNSGNEGFRQVLNGEYIDKTGLVGVMNKKINSRNSLVCVSRPRRFGKSIAAKMLCAYYDCTCDSDGLFSGLKIQKDESYKKHLNKYNVIAIDVAGIISETIYKNEAIKDIPEKLSELIRKELIEYCPDIKNRDSIISCFIECAEITGRKFVFVIDEWDAVIREAKNDEAAQKAYFNLLRGWFKNSNFTPKVVAAAYMTGILPIKKDGSQSAISDFSEYTMLAPQGFSEYVGFNEEEVKKLCEKYDVNFDCVKRWYDGYTVGSCRSVYNPYSVMQAMESGKFTSYWKKTSAAETLITYIDMDQMGLQADIIRLIAGEEIEVDPDSFRNDIETFTSKDDVLTLLIHLGYLTYEEITDSYDENERMTGMVRIPNEEVRTEFDKLLRKAKHTELVRLVGKSDKLLKDTIAGNEEAVAEAIQEVHDSGYAPTYYNNEQSLRYVVKMAYISCVDQYSKVEELPSGHGISDTVFIPKRRSALPAMIVELKWNKSIEGAIRQIKENGYQNVLKNYGGDVILVGINYDTDSKTHSCKIEKINCTHN